MSTYAKPTQKSVEPTDEQFTVVDTPAAPIYNVRNDEKDTIYTVIANGHDEAQSCSCPHYKYRSAFCKHMTAVEESVREDKTDDDEGAGTIDSGELEQGDIVNIDVFADYEGEQFEIQRVESIKVLAKSCDDGRWVKMDRGQASRYVTSTAPDDGDDGDHCGEETIDGPFVEPPEQGGELYYRCTACGREALDVQYVHQGC